MDIELAAFRLNTLTTLTRTGTATSREGAAATDFLGALINARSALLPGAGGAVANPFEGELTRMNSVLAQLEASNSAFLRRYNARVEAIGDEAEVLTQLRARLAELGTTSQALASVDTGRGDGELRAALQDFVARYNDWDATFDPYFEPGALLDDNQAGEVARYSLRREVGSLFHGAGNGGFAQGLTDMGVRIGADGQLSVDPTAFDAALAADRQGAVQTLNNMARAFGEAATVLAADGHLLDRRIDNAERAVAWAADNQAGVEAEFGPGALSARLGRNAV